MLYIACAVLWLLRFALGASIFSFLGVVIWRLPRGESVVKGRSHCPACGRTLSAAELVPCLSFLVQGGRCRGCGARIPARDFWLEVLGGLCSCACCAAFGGETARAALSFAVLGILTVVAFMDIDTLEIYDRFPALTGYIDKAKDKNVTTETRQAVMAAQTLADEDYANGTTTGASATSAAILKLADLPDNDEAIATVVGGKVTTLVYTDTSAGRKCTYSNGRYGKVENAA